MTNQGRVQQPETTLGYAMVWKEWNKLLKLFKLSYSAVSSIFCKLACFLLLQIVAEKVTGKYSGLCFSATPALNSQRSLFGCKCTTQKQRDVLPCLCSPNTLLLFCVSSQTAQGFCCPILSIIKPLFVTWYKLINLIILSL